MIIFEYLWNGAISESVLITKSFREFFRVDIFLGLVNHALAELSLVEVGLAGVGGRDGLGGLHDHLHLLVPLQRHDRVRAAIPEHRSH